MKAYVYEEYGSPDVLKLQEIPTPIPNDDEVRVKIHAVSINSADIDLLRGAAIIKMAAPFKPHYKILGSDVAGVIDYVGKNVSGYKIGDEVYGDMTECGFGTFCEYICIKERNVRLKPANMSFEEAAALPSAAVIAYQGIHNLAKIKTGDEVLINGAGGGMGTYALQMAKMYGAKVTGVDTGKKLNLILDLGADQVIDFTKENYIKNRKKYDLILDCQSYFSALKYPKKLKENGIYYIIGGSIRSLLSVFLIGSVISKYSSKKIKVLLGRPNEEKHLEKLREFFELGHLNPVIDKVYDFDQLVDAVKYFETNDFIGKVVVKII